MIIHKIINYIKLNYNLKMCAANTPSYHEDKKIFMRLLVSVSFLLFSFRNHWYQNWLNILDTVNLISTKDFNLTFLKTTKKKKLKQLRSFTSSTVTDNIWFLVIKLEDIANADVGPVSFVFLGLLDSEICQVILPEQQKIINTNLFWNKSLEYSLIWK